MENLLDLKNITLIALGSTVISETIKAVKICLKQALFKEVLFFTNIENHSDEKGIKYVCIDKINTVHEYQIFKVKIMPSILLPVLQTDYYLIIDWDGFIVNTDAWSDAFLGFDYIGAPFPFGDICGNGGFSLRSRKFLETQYDLCKDFNIYNLPEDVVLSFVLRSKFKNRGCSHSPTKIGYQFATESGGYDNYKSFGFHSFLYNPQFKSRLSAFDGKKFSSCFSR